jgi:1-acyl-sn-glycerol-3-phosphate acyltransferase
MQISDARPVQFQGNVLVQRLLRWAGWQIYFDGFPCLQGVMVGYPHTSNWDFILMVMVKWATGLQVKFLAKDSLFRYPIFSPWLRSLGGVAIDRSAANGVVGQLVELLRQYKNSQQYFWIGLAPEGTRRLTPGWKSGFYQVALQAEVPLCLLRIDWGHKTVDFRQVLSLSGHMQNDYVQMAQAFEGVQGFHPQQASPIRPLESGTSVSVGETRS